MALWKPFRGTSAALADVPKTDGHAYFCTDDGSLFFDYKDANGELHRKQITAKELTPVNLLDEPIVISTLENPADANYIFLDRSLGFTLGGTYILNYTYKGITKDITLIGYSQSQAGMGDEDTGVVIPQERMGQDFSFWTDDNGSSSDGSGSFVVMILDKCQATDEGIAYNENSAIIMVHANTENYALPFTINSIIATGATTIIPDIQNMQNMLVARSSSKFDSLISSANIGKAVSYKKDLYIIDAGAKEIKVGDNLNIIYFDTSVEPNLAALSYENESGSPAIFGMDSSANREYPIIGAMRWDSLNTGVSGYGLVGYSSSSGGMTVLYSTVAFTVPLLDLTVYKGWNVSSFNLTRTVPVTKYEAGAKSVLGHVLSSAVISSDNPVAISMLKHEEDPTVPAWAKAAEKPTYDYDEIGNTPSLATVATSGSYNDLTNKPTIPAAVTVDSALSSTSTNPVQNTVINAALANKVDKVSGKGLSTNDLTATLKSNYDTAYTHSQATHARTDATKVEASSTNGNIKINGTETTVYTHPTGTNPHGTTKSDIGLGNVGNFKAVSTAANQGLSDTEKSNARANIGAGTSSFTGYTSSNKLAASNVSGLATVATSGSYGDLTNKPTIPTNTSQLVNDNDFIESNPAKDGNVKTSYRIAKQGYTNGANWYYKLCTLPANNSQNFASVIISGRIGGWESVNMSYINALVWNRGTPGISVIDIAGDATATSNIWSIGDLALYVESDGSASLYILCKNYFTFDLNVELYQSTAMITYDGTYITSPTGTLAAQCSNTNKRLELANGQLQLNGKSVLTEASYNASTKTLTIG